MNGTGSYQESLIRNKGSIILVILPPFWKTVKSFIYERYSISRW